MTALTMTNDRAPRGGAPQRARETAALSTPRRLKVALGVVLAATALFYVVATVRIASVYVVVHTVGKDSVPSIVAAEEIRAAFARANLHALQAIAAKPADAGEAWRHHDEDLALAADRLVTAARNITYGDAERVPITQMIEKTSAYSRAIGVARAKSGRPESPALLREATSILRREILPAADALDKANFAPLDAEYSSSREETNAGLVAAGLLLLLVLGGTQAWLAFRFKRLVSLPLAAASVLVFGTIVHCAVALETATEQVRVAKEDAFDSIHALWRARAIALDAASDEALYVLGGPGTDETAFADRSLQLARGSLDDESIRGLLGHQPVELRGLIADELRNVTFQGEEQAAVNLAGAYRDYECAHEDAAVQVRRGSAPLAVSRCLGNGGDVRGRLERFDECLGSTLDINQRGFDGSVAMAFDEVSGLPAVAAVASLAVAGLAWLGVRPRLREYAA
jgi:hypothetical protein